MLVSAAQASYPASEQAIWCTMQPDRCDLTGVIVKRILVAYKFDVHPTLIHLIQNVSSFRYSV
jgi:hypothetical protein